MVNVHARAAARQILISADNAAVKIKKLMDAALKDEAHFGDYIPAMREAYIAYDKDKSLAKAPEAQVLQAKDLNIGALNTDNEAEIKKLATEVTLRELAPAIKSKNIKASVKVLEPKVKLGELAIELDSVDYILRPPQDGGQKLNTPLEQESKAFNPEGIIEDLQEVVAPKARQQQDNNDTSSSSGSTSVYKGLDLIIQNLLREAGLQPGAIARIIQYPSSSAYQGAAEYARRVLVASGLKEPSFWQRNFQRQKANEYIHEQLLAADPDKLNKALQGVLRDLVGQAGRNHGKVYGKVEQNEFNKLTTAEQEAALAKWSNGELNEKDIMAALEVQNPGIFKQLMNALGYETLAVCFILASLFMPGLVPLIYAVLFFKVATDIVVGVVDALSKGVAMLPALWSGFVNVLAVIPKLAWNLVLAPIVALFAIPEAIKNKSFEPLQNVWKVGNNVITTAAEIVSGEKALEDRKIQTSKKLEGTEFTGLPPKAPAAQPPTVDLASKTPQQGNAVLLNQSVPGVKQQVSETEKTEKQKQPANNIIIQSVKKGEDIKPAITPKLSPKGAFIQ